VEPDRIYLLLEYVQVLKFINLSELESILANLPLAVQPANDGRNRDIHLVVCPQFGLSTVANVDNAHLAAENVVVDESKLLALVEKDPGGLLIGG